MSLIVGGLYKRNLITEVFLCVCFITRGQCCIQPRKQQYRGIPFIKDYITRNFHGNMQACLMGQSKDYRSSDKSLSRDCTSHRHICIRVLALTFASKHCRSSAILLWSSVAIAGLFITEQTSEKVSLTVKADHRSCWSFFQHLIKYAAVCWGNRWGCFANCSAPL